MVPPFVVVKQNKMGVQTLLSQTFTDTQRMIRERDIESLINYLRVGEEARIEQVLSKLRDEREEAENDV